MKLKAIELVGFKSFAKKSKLDFSVPVTGIVGPNGSGKSNVVEAFRFVLGEQSMKSLRGKSGKDLVFKGSKDLPKSNRAAVSITFDNKDKVFKLGDSNINLDFDEITLKREVYADGTNTYYINDTSVRLKDIVELLASVNIGSSGHHIISQGQADRILSASSKDRRGMIEDALGLKVYQYKLRDAGKKLEKTAENMKEVGVMRRELAPHIKYLQKQVEKIEKGRELRRDLSVAYVEYFKTEESTLAAEEFDAKSKHADVEKELASVEVKLRAFGDSAAHSLEDKKGEELGKIQKEIVALERAKEELMRKLGRIEGVIEFQAKNESRAQTAITMNRAELAAFVESLMSAVDASLIDTDLERVRTYMRSIKSTVENFQAKWNRETSSEPSANTFKDLKETQQEVAHQLEELERTKNGLEEAAAGIRREIEEARKNVFKDQEERFSLESRKATLQSSLELLRVRTEALRLRKNAFEEEIKEAVVLVGSEIMNFRNEQGGSTPTPDLKKQIERMKIRLEDIGTGSGADVLKEYEEVTERDAFLSRELEDLEKSMVNLRTLIEDLKETLEREFKEGVEKINARFEEFFKLMFGGGSAYLSAVVQSVRQNSVSEDEELEDQLVADDKLDYGIDINVTLPHKKVKDLHMLSGGERSLTSIALVFAVTQVNPPPFLVLDETDAALDEANSRRYGDMIEILSKYSELIIVTHNRETMSRADIIYGVTVGSDGASKLLSIRFEEAESYAK